MLTFLKKIRYNIQYKTKYNLHEKTEYAKKAIAQEYEKYKTQLKNGGVKYKILWEKINEDGSIVIEIKRQYNNSSVGDYFN